MALWIADAERGLMHISKMSERLHPAALCLTVCGGLVICAAPDRALCFAPDARPTGEYPLPPGVCRMCALPGALYALSSEADSVSLLCPVTGRLRLCAQAGCYPRDMQLSPCGRYLAVSGGAAGQLLLYAAQDLTLLRRIPLPGIACAAVFSGQQLFAVCAVEENELTTHVLRISPRGVQSEIFTVCAMPGALHSLHDHTLLLGVLGESIRLRADGRVLQRYPAGLVQSIRAYAGFALAADPLSGQVQRVPYAIGKSAGVVYPGASPSDMLLI